ncbi:hypothetical protein [Nostoc sp.]
MNVNQKKNVEVKWQSDEPYKPQFGSYYARDKSGKLLFVTTPEFINIPNFDLNKEKVFNFNPDGTLFVVVDSHNLKIWDSSGRLLSTSEIDEQREQGYRHIQFSNDGSLLVIEKCSDADKCIPFKYFKLETSDELIVRGCNLARDYLQNNPNVSKSDRHLCDDVPPTAANPNN